MICIVFCRQDSWPFTSDPMIKWFWTPFNVGSYNLADFIGRYIPSHGNNIRFFPLWVCRIMASARAILVVLMVLTAAPDIGWDSSFLYLVFLFIHGLCSGSAVTATFMHGPVLAEPHKRADASSLHMLGLFAGISGGYFVR